MSQIAKNNLGGVAPSTLVSTITTQDGIATAAGNNLNYNGYPQVLAAPQIGMTHGSGSTFTYEDMTWLTPYVVDNSTTVGSRGTYSSIQSAITDAPIGATVLVRSGTYAGDLTLKAGVNILGLDSADPNNSTIIVGTITATFAGSCSISGVTLRTNSAPFLTVSGSNATIVNLESCYLDCLNNTGISHTASNVGSRIIIDNCDGNIATTGITFYVSTSTGTINSSNCTITNTGSATTATSASAANCEFHNCDIYFPLVASGSGSFTNYNTNIITTPINTTSLTTSGTGISSMNLCGLQGGSASAVSIGAGTTVALNQCDINSSNTNAISGTGSLQSTLITFSGTSSVINPTTQSFTYSQLGKFKASQQPAFSAYLAADSLDQTGDGTTYQLGTNALTELFDIGSNFNTNGTFTAPVTGIYLFCYGTLLQQLVTANTVILTLVADGITYRYGNTGTSFTGNQPFSDSRIVQMTAGSTAVVTIQASGGTKTVDIYGGGSDPRTFFSGYQIA